MLQKPKVKFSLVYVFNVITLFVSLLLVIFLKRMHFYLPYFYLLYLEMTFSLFVANVKVITAHISLTCQNIIHSHTSSKKISMYYLCSHFHHKIQFHHLSYCKISNFFLLYPSSNTMQLSFKYKKNKVRE